MRKSAFLKRIALISCLALVLSVIPLASATAAEFDWTKEADKGVTNPNNLHLAPGAVFQEKQMIYATAFIGVGGPDASIYTYDGTMFNQVGDRGFGDPNNSGLHPTAVYNNELYIGTANHTTGCELFRWNGEGDPLLVPQSAGGWGAGAENDSLFPQGVVNNKLVVTIANRPPSANPGLRVYEFDGTAWTQLVGMDPGALMPPGFGNPENTFAAPGVIYRDKLVISAGKSNAAAGGLEVWEYDGTGFTKIGEPGIDTWTTTQKLGVAAVGRNDPVDPDDDILYLGTGDMTGAEGCQLLSYDGTAWTQIKTGGIVGTDDNFVQPLVCGEDLYLATSDFVNGCRVYRLVGADYMPLSEVGFGAGVNSPSAFIGLFANKMLACTLNMSGGEVWTTPMLSQRWFFAEGTTRDNADDGSYDQWICIQNPGANEANVKLTYMMTNGATEIQNTTVDPETRKTISVNDYIGADKDVSTVVESDWPILVERPMYFDYRNKWPGGHIVMGVAMPQQNWYFAEGTTRDNQYDGSYEEWLCIQNPNPGDVDVQITYMLETGQTIVKDYPVGATSRRTVDVNRDVGENHDVSMLVQCGLPIVAERPMYFNYRNKWKGGHNVVGAPGPARQFYFAEGTTRDNATDGSFEEWISIQNPGAAAATVDITYWTEQSGTETQRVTVAANSRATVDVKLKLGPDVDTSFNIESDQPILVERPMYFNYHNAWDGGHNVMGCAGPKKSFYFAEGTTLTEFNTYVAVLNPGDEAAEVTFTYMIEGEPNKSVTITLGAEKRYTQNVASEIGDNENVSILVESDKPIVAERPMYFGYHGEWAGGHDTLGLGI